MQNLSILKVYKKLLIVAIFATFSLGIVTSIYSERVEAQVQGQEFSGNQKSSYQCFDSAGDSIEPTDVKDAFGYWLCPCADGATPNNAGKCPGSVCETARPGDAGCAARRSTLKPPTLQQLEIWFVRIVYVLWAVVGSFSFLFLVLLGYRYMVSRGDVTKITEIRQKITYYIIGFVLVFLAVPILTTVFRVLGINNQVQCYNVDMPAFQFVFTDLCSDTTGTFVSDPCQIGQDGDGLACDTPLVNQERICFNNPRQSPISWGYICKDTLVWEYFEFDSRIR